MRYGVIWHPTSSNLGDDLQALAAGGLLPKIDLALDGGKLDQSPPGEGEVVTLLSGNAMRCRYRWPPHPALRTVCLGLHISREDVWGSHLDALEGLGLEYLRDRAPVGCRDEATAALLAGLGVESYVSCCLTLTLPRPEGVSRKERYICCVDAPEKVTEVLCRFAQAEHVTLREMTHQLPPEAASESFEERMSRARETLRIYAGAEFVVTRRLHCALSCLAMEVPVLLLYNSGYEDPRRFSPMDGLFTMVPVEDFSVSVARNGFPKLAPNPGKYLVWRRLLKGKADEGIRLATENASVPQLNQGAATAWQRQTLLALADASAAKIRRLEKEQYELIHDKFSLLLTEDSVKAHMLDCLTQPGLEDALRAFTRAKVLARTPWRKRPALRRELRRARREGELPKELEKEDILTFLTSELARLGWPDARPKEEEEAKEEKGGNRLL